MILKQKIFKFIKNINSIVLIIPIILIAILVKALAIYFKDILLTNLSINILSIVFTIDLFLLISKVFINSNKGYMRCLIKVFVVGYIIIGGLFYFTESPEYVIEKNGKKMLAVVDNGLFKVSVYYYKDGNYFFYKGDNLEFIEFYSGSLDPIKNPEEGERRGICYIKDDY